MERFEAGIRHNTPKTKEAHLGRKEMRDSNQTVF